MLNRPVLLFVNMRRIESEQAESIYAARSLGYDIVLLTNKKISSQYERFFLHIEIVDTFDHELILATVDKIIKFFTVVGVPSWTEADIEIVARICEKLKLPGLPLKAAVLARNKYEMKAALADFPHLLPKFFRINNIASLNDAINTVSFPAVMKPIGASGSKGIFVIHTKEEAYDAFRKLQIIATPHFDPIFKQYGNELIFEEYLYGNEFSVEGFVVNHKVFIAGITDKWTTYPYHIEYQHVYPSHMDKNIKDEIYTKTLYIINKLGFNNCGFHLEAKITPRGFRFIEIAARLGGDYITSHLVRFSTGTNMFENIIRIAVGKNLNINKSIEKISGIRFILAHKTGKFNAIQGITEMLQNSFLENTFSEIPIGSKIILPPNDFSKIRLMACIVTNPSYEQCVHNLEKISKTCLPVIS